MRQKIRQDEQRKTREIAYNNIQQTHNNVCQHFRQIRDKIPKIDDLLVLHSDNPIEDSLLQKYKHDVEDEIQKIQNNRNEYMKSTKVLLAKFQPLSERPITVSFMNPIEDENPAQVYIDTYNDIAREYYPIIFSESNNANKCNNCHKNGIRELENRTICTFCGMTNWKQISTITFADEGESIAKCIYERPSFFKIWVKRYQGKHSPKINPDVYRTLFDLFKRYDIEVKTLTKMELVLMLRDNSLSHHVEDINFLYYEILRRVADNTFAAPDPPDISIFENKLFAEYSMYDSIYNDALQMAKELFPTIDRENSTNSFYTLCKLLERQNYMVSKEDREIFLKCDDKIIEHDHIWMIACQLLHWNYMETL